MDIKKWAGNLFKKGSRTFAVIIASTKGEKISYIGDDFESYVREGYSSNTVVYKSIEEIAKAVSGVAFHVYNNDPKDKKLLSDHPIEILLNKPNPFRSFQTLKHQLMVNMLLSGNGFLEGVGPRRGINGGSITELWALRPDRMRIIATRHGIKEYRYSTGTNKVAYPVNRKTGLSEIFHMQLPNPAAEYFEGGLSPFKAAASMIDLHNSYTTWNTTLVASGANPSGILSTDKRIDKNMRDVIEKYLMERSGLMKAGMPLIIGDGFKWVQSGLTPKEMDFNEAMNLVAREIANAFGVPPQLINIAGDSTFSNVKEARIWFWETTIKFYLDLFKNELNRWLTPRYGENADIVIDYDITKVTALQQKRVALFEVAKDANFLTVNEKRALVNYGKYEGDIGDKILVDGKLITLDDVGKELENTSSEGATE